MFRNPFARRRRGHVLELDLTALPGFTSCGHDRGLKDAGDALALMAAAIGGTRLPDAEVCAILTTYGETYGRTPFKTGDFVVRRPNTGGHGEGWPALVLEVSPTPHRNFYLDSRTTPEADPDYGARYDMRILHRNPDGRVHAHWCESWLFVPYTGALTVGVDVGAEDGDRTAVFEVDAGTGETRAIEPDPVDTFTLEERLAAMRTPVVDPERKPLVVTLGEGQTATVGHPVEMAGCVHGLALSATDVLAAGPCAVPWHGPGAVGDQVWFEGASGLYNAGGIGRIIPGWILVGVTGGAYANIEVN